VSSVTEPATLIEWGVGYQVHRLRARPGGDLCADASVRSADCRAPRAAALPPLPLGRGARPNAQAGPLQLCGAQQAGRRAPNPVAQPADCWCGARAPSSKYTFLAQPIWPWSARPQHCDAHIVLQPVPTGAPRTQLTPAHAPVSAGRQDSAKPPVSQLTLGDGRVRPFQTSYAAEFAPPFASGAALRSPLRNQGLAEASTDLRAVYRSAFQRTGECAPAPRGPASAPANQCHRLAFAWGLPCVCMGPA